MSTSVLEKTAAFQDITPEQVDALKKQSQAAYDAEIKSREELVSQRPGLAASFDQQVQPHSKCGCGSQQNICGYFNFEGCGCGCGNYTETVQISGVPVVIGPNAPQQGTTVRFSGQATGPGTGPSINIPSIYLQGAVPDAENLVGITLQLNLSISPGSLYLTLVEGTRVLAVLVPQYSGNITEQFYGSGTGMFTVA